MLTAHQAAACAASYDEVRAAGGAVWWLESRPAEDGRNALLRLAEDGTASEVTPRWADVGSALHGYGGGSFAVDGPRVWYLDAADRCLWLLEPGRGYRVVAQPGGSDEHFGDLTASGGQLWYVRESDRGDALIQVSPDGTSRVLANTEGFLGSPRLADGRFAWLQWDADQMPWDGSVLMSARLTPDGLAERSRVAGGEQESVTQPCWAGDGRLWFVSDRSGWWNLYTWDGRHVTAAVLMQADVAPPEWEAGYASYVPLPGGGVVTTVLDGPRHRIEVRAAAGRRVLADGYTSVKPYLAMGRDRLVGIIASPSQPPLPSAFDLTGATTSPRPLVTSPASPSGGDPAEPRILRVPGDDDALITVALYLPSGGTGAQGPAPLVVRAHPGPTSSISLRLDWHVRFLTSHGFAVVDVDYRGSAGYGREFRRGLYGRWGTADVQDCAAVARYLLKARYAQAGAVFISGASAGGYTALQSVSGESVFAGAVARSAIVDPGRWRQTAPRWQRPHAAALLGPAGAVDPEAITRPVLLIHGAQDHVAPLSDVTALADRLAARGHRHELLVLGSAKHILSAQQDTAQALQAEVDFYRGAVGG